jgi:F-type H+-transporting ATPase subunit epsilon
MAQQLLQLTISRVDGAVFSGEVRGVQVPGIEGEMTILAHHEPLISPLRPGVVTVTTADGSHETFSVANGTIEVSLNQATILI